MQKEKTTQNSQSLHKAIYRELFPEKLSKSDKRKIEILQGAIKAFAAVNYNHVSFDDIASPAHTSRRLVQHYFPDKDELFELTMKMIRAEYQASVIAAFSRATTPEIRFKEYVTSAIEWARSQPTHVRSWFLFYLVCSQRPRFRKMHEDLARIGEERIGALVSEMRPSKSIRQEDKTFVAKSVQRLITGALVEILSETTDPDVDRIQGEVVKACVAVINSIG